jgi:hypothetical protein
MTDLSPATWTQLVHQALKHWRNGHEATGLTSLAIFGTYHRVDGQTVTRQLLNDAVEQLEKSDRSQAELLRLRFLKNKTPSEMARQWGCSEAAIYRHQKEAIAQLAAILAAQETQLRYQRQAQFASRLETPTYEQLFGVETALATLRTWLGNKDGPFLLSIEGLGGVGKTSLADALTRQAIAASHFDEFAWVSVRDRLLLAGEIQPIPLAGQKTETVVETLARQLLPPEAIPPAFAVERVQPALEAHFKTHPTLVVIDNLETLTDLPVLLPLLQRWAGPSKFVLTSRNQLPRLLGILPFPVPELAEPAAHALLRHCAERSALNPATLDEAALGAIYATAGGNPLALKLVAGQLHNHGVAEVLAALRQAHGRSTEQLYTFIYGRAWQELETPAQQALLALLQAPSTGFTAEEWGIVSELPPGALYEAIDQLVKGSLVNRLSNEGASPARYSLHGLTRTFLLEQATQW